MVIKLVVMPVEFISYAPLVGLVTQKRMIFWVCFCFFKSQILCTKLKGLTVKQKTDETIKSFDYTINKDLVLY